ncbi:MAG: septation protein A [Burkholderiales bacterium]|jgi:intracellular septation protein|nr:septation protein A [Burkholderiales bacterium]
MAILLDYLPLILFFGVYKVTGSIYYATATAIAASVLQIVYLYFKKKIGVIHWLQLAVISIFGGATLIFRDPEFIKWKPTVLYAAFAIILTVGKLGFKQDLLRYVMKPFTLPPSVWTKLTWAWVAFFIGLAILNRVVATHYSEATWVNFKVFGTLILIVLFMIPLGFYLSPYLKDSDKTLEDEIPKK